VLTAAALTYLAAFITSVLQFLYYLRVVDREVEEDRAREARREQRQQQMARRR
jgi:heme exporter protein D